MLNHLVVLAALAATLALAGCGETTIDSAKGETFIRGVVTDQIGAKVKTVSCPDDVKAMKGDMFKCQVTAADGSKGDVDVTQADDAGNVKVNADFLHVREAEQVISQQISRPGAPTAKVACQEIVLVAKGERFGCTATSGSDELELAVRLTDDTGKFAFKRAS